MSAVIITTPQKFSVGSSAEEFKEVIGKFTYQGFAYTLVVLVLLFLINFSISLFKEVEILPISMRQEITHIGIATQTPKNDVPRAPQQPSQMRKASLASVVGNPVPETPNQNGAKEFANNDDISKATSQVGNNVDEDGGGNGKQTGIIGGTKADIDGDGEEKVEDEEDAPTFVEQMPTVDLADILRHLVYPEIAKRAGIEGVVTVYILVSKTGKPVRTKIIDSGNSMLNSAAEKACLEATFTPGIQNGQPVDVWLAVPVRFSLR